MAQQIIDLSLAIEDNHVDAFRTVSPAGAPVDEMPLDLFIGKAVCFDPRHVPGLQGIRGGTTLCYPAVNKNNKSSGRKRL